MNKLLKSLKTLIWLQNVILAYLVLLFGTMVITALVPDKSAILGIMLPLFYAMVIFAPFAIATLAYSIRVFTLLARTSPTSVRKVKFASWFSVVAGLYILGSFLFHSQISLWAGQISHDLVVAAESSRVILGLGLLATHVYVARSAYREARFSQ